MATVQSESLPRFTLLATILAMGALLLIAAVACASILRYGASNGDSIEINLVWLKNFSAQLTQGDIYPRWLMNMNRGFGSPAFYFYAPVPFYVASIPVLLMPGLRLTLQLAYGEYLLIAASGLSFFWYAQRRFGLSTALYGSVIYMLLPYHFEIDLWRRQDLGELANYVWMPLALHYTEELFAHHRGVAGLAVSYALMLGSHLPSTLLFSICLGVYVLIQLSDRRSFADLARFAGAIGIGLLLSALYWVPAIFGLQYVDADQLWWWYYDFHLWLFPINAWFRNYPAAQEFATRLFSMIGVAVAIFTLCWVPALRLRDTGELRKLLGYLGSVAAACFLMSSWSTRVWEQAPALWKVQFPWRFALAVDLAAAVALLYALRGALRDRDMLGAAGAVISVGLLNWCFISSDVRASLDPLLDSSYIAARDGDVINGVDVAEYMPRWNSSIRENPSGAIAPRNQLSYQTERGTVTNVRWKPRDIALDVRLDEPATVNVRQYYFPNWHATKQPDGVPLRVTPEGQTGLILIDLPAGSYRVDLELDLLPQESIGAALSALGLMLLIVSSVWRGIVGKFLHRATDQT